MRVGQRTDDDHSGGYSTGLAIQALLVVVTIVALYYNQSGEVVAWWCQVGLYKLPSRS